MTEAEVQSWRQFHRESPIDDFNRIYRPAALIAHLQGGGDVKALLEWLSPEYEDDGIVNGLSLADRRTMRAFGFTKKGG